MERQDMDIDADQETFETMVAGLVKHIFGQGEAGIRKQLEASQDMPRDIGSLAYTMVGAAAAQAEDAGREIDLDMVMGVAAEVIDSIMQLGEAIGVIEDADDDDLRGEAMMRAVEAYIMSGEASPEEQEAARQMLAQMSEDGEFDEAQGYVAELGQKSGMDPFADDEPAAPGAPVDAAASAGQPPAENAGPRPALMQA